MEDDLNILANGRRHQTVGKLKTALNSLANKRQPHILKNGRQPQSFVNFKTNASLALVEMAARLYTSE